MTAIIRDKLRRGALPTAQPTKLWAGYGTGERCSGCDGPILPAQVEYEFRGEPHAGNVVRFHLGCYGLWEAELRRQGHRLARGADAASAASDF